MTKSTFSNYLCRKMFPICIVEVILTAIVAPCYASQIEKEPCKAAQTSLEQLQMVDTKLATKSAIYTSESPVIKSLTMQRQALTERLQSQVKLCPSSQSKIYSPLSEPVMGLW